LKRPSNHVFRTLNSKELSDELMEHKEAADAHGRVRRNDQPSEEYF